MTNDELLKPRFKVIADYPHMEDDWKLGDILDRDWGWDGDDEIGFKHHISDYPDIFKLLLWWEERKLKDLPKYLKPDTKNELIKGFTTEAKKQVVMVDKYDISTKQVKCFLKENISRPLSLEILLPATKEEYEQFITSQK